MTVHLSAAGQEAGPTVIIHLISVPVTERGRGLGQRVLDTICETADEEQWTLALTPVGDLGSEVTRLVRWYTAAGFRPSRAVAKQVMVRTPTWRAAT